MSLKIDNVAALSEVFHIFDLSIFQSKEQNQRLFNLEVLQK